LRDKFDVVMQHRLLFIIVPFCLSLPTAHYLASGRKKNFFAISVLVLCPILVTALAALAFQGGLGSPEVPYPN
jgi:hypothetical protein